METLIVDKNDLKMCADCIKKGGLVVFPTETVYGIGADYSNDLAVKKIYKAKGRPSDNPLIVHIGRKSDVKKIAREIPKYAKKIMDKFWPGPLTLIFKKQPHVLDSVTAGLDTVAIRLPSNEIARNLIKLTNTFVVAPSANLSGSPSPTTYSHVADDLFGRVDFIIKGENCDIGLESTVVDVSGEYPVILRPGAITIEMLIEVAGYAEFDKNIFSYADKPKCPGMKYTHYSPKANVIVICGSKEDRKRYIDTNVDFSKNVGIMSYMNNEYPNCKKVICAGNSMDEYGHNLFFNLRAFDEFNIETVYAEFEDTDGLGIAVKNRLFKSAGYNIINV